jgi:nucleoside-diphosphate-sugar epimerase
MKVVVTGSSGFIGTHLVTELARAGWDVHGLDIRPPQAIGAWTHHECDLLDAGLLKRTLQEIDPAIVVHLAARTDLDEERDIAGYAVNFEGVENLLAAVEAAPGIERCIVTSSQLVCRIGYTPVGDTDYAPSTLYGQSKVRTEQIWREKDGAMRTWCIARPTTVWGPGMNPHYLTFFRMVRDGLYFHVGSGETRKSYAYVGNVVHQFVKLMESPPELIHGRVFYLADYEPVTLKEWAESFREALGGPKIRSIPRWAARSMAAIGDVLNAAGIRRFPFNSFRLNNVLTESPAPVENTARVCGPLPYTMKDGVAETVAWLSRTWAREAAA